MRIVQLVPYAMDRPGGVQSHVRALTGWLREQGHEVRVIAPRGQVGPDEEGQTSLGRARAIKVHGTGFELSFAGQGECGALARSLRDWGAELVHYHTPWTPFLPEQVWRMLDLPAVSTFHATLPLPRPIDPVLWYIQRAARCWARRSACVIVPSPVPQAQWQAQGIETRVIPPAVNLKPWQEAAARHKHFAARVLYMGRFEPRKGLDVLLTAWPAVAKAVPGAQLTVAGPGTPPGPLGARLAAGKIANARLLPAPDDRAARQLVAASDLTVSPALSGESFGLVLAEAMAAGALPVAAANAGYASVLTGPGAALLVPPGDSEALACRIVALLGDSDTRARLASWARDHATGFDIRACGPQIVACYAQALGR